MSTFHGKVDSLGLSFFGSMTASISHEIKNELATINENAGLITDLTELSENGRPLDVGRLKNIAQSICRRVNNADNIVRRLNRFAHSANQPIVSTGIRDIIACSVALSDRLATMKGVTLTLEPGEEIEVQTVPFVLENLLWIYLKNIFLVAEKQQQVALEVHRVDTDIVITMNCTPELSLEQVENMAASEAQPLLFYLRIQVERQQSMFKVRVPMQFID